MRDLPTEIEIRQAYRPVYEFLEEIPKIVEEAETAPTSEELEGLADEIVGTIHSLKETFPKFGQLRAIANQTVNPQPIGKSDAWAVEAVAVFGSGIALWVENVQQFLFSAELILDGRKEIGPYDINEPEFPYSEEDLEQCRDLLMDEEAMLISQLRRENEVRTKGRSAKNQQSNETGHSKKLRKGKAEKSSTDELFLAALRNWHKFETESFHNTPIGVRELSEFMLEQDSEIEGFSSSSVGRFFERHFGSHREYKIACQHKKIDKLLQQKSSEAVKKRVLSELGQDLTDVLTGANDGTLPRDD